MTAPPAEEVKNVLLGMKLNQIWLWGSSFKALGIVEYFFIAITLRFTLTQSCS